MNLKFEGPCRWPHCTNVRLPPGRVTQFCTPHENALMAQYPHLWKLLCLNVNKGVVDERTLVEIVDVLHDEIPY